MSEASFGYFTPDGMEYVVTTPHTPRDWFNYLWNPTYLACLSQNFNGMSLYQDEKGFVTNLLNVVDRFLGFRRTLKGFRLEPQIPSAWKQLAFTRPFRGVAFQIEIRRGAKPGIWVDGCPIEGTFIPVPAATPGKKTVHIKCAIG